MMLVVEIAEHFIILTLENKTNDIYFSGGTPTNGLSIGRANNPSLGYFEVSWLFDYGSIGSSLSVNSILTDSSESIGWYYMLTSSSKSFLLLFNTADGSLNKCYTSDIGYNTDNYYMRSFSFDPTSTYIYSFFATTSKFCKITISNGAYTCLTSSGLKSFQHLIYLDADTFLLDQYDFSGKVHQYLKLKYQASTSFPLLKISCVNGDSWTSALSYSKSIYDGSSKIYTSIPKSSNSYSLFAIIDSSSFSFTQIYYSTFTWYFQMGIVMSASKIFSTVRYWYDAFDNNYIFIFDISSSTFTLFKFTDSFYFGIGIGKDYNLFVSRDADSISKINLYSFLSDYKMLILNLTIVKINL